MDLNPCNDYNNNSNISNKKYLLVKIPANVKNPIKAIEALGNREKIYSKVKNKLISLLMMKISN
jgi:hypothetical protein